MATLKMVDLKGRYPKSSASLKSELLKLRWETEADDINTQGKRASLLLKLLTLFSS